MSVWCMYVCVWTGVGLYNVCGIHLLVYMYLFTILVHTLHVHHMTLCELSISTLGVCRCEKGEDMEGGRVRAPFIYVGGTIRSHNKNTHL